MVSTQFNLCEFTKKNDVEERVWDDWLGIFIKVLDHLLCRFNGFTQIYYANNLRKSIKFVVSVI